MKRSTVLFCLLCAGLSTTAAQDISSSRIRAHVKFLSSDLLEGRGVGERGGFLTEEYLASQFDLAGARPAGDKGTFFQAVPLLGVTTRPEAYLEAVKEKSLRLAWIKDFVGVTQRQTELEQFDAEAFFVGHGITAPEFRWNDYAGTDVKGKVVVMFTNEPSSEDPAFFGGPGLTYYGRWTYKFEQAARQGAVAAVLIHTTPTAGYGWDVVRNSWGREDAQVRLPAGSPALAFSGWLTQEAGDQLLALSGRSVKEMLKLAGTRGFKPIPLGIRLKGRVPAKIRSIQTSNVVAVVEGSDAALRQEAVAFTAHWDHLGIGPPAGGDSIYNGAVDNATGCAIILELARAWAALNPRPRRSALFLAVTAEEAGLRGAQHYVSNPVFPVGRTSAVLNFDSFLPLGRTLDVVVNGAERTTLWPAVQEAARRFGLKIMPDPNPAQGSYFRSDHFPFAQAGVPAFSVKMGTDYIGSTEATKAAQREFGQRHYHRPSDEFRQDWDFSGLAEIARFGFLIALNAANRDDLPTWNAGDEFLPARQKSGVR